MDSVYIGIDRSTKEKGLFKIGRTSNPERRERQIKNMNPTFIILAYVEVDNSCEIEKALHDKYSDRHELGEWFRLSIDEVAVLTNLDGILLRVMVSKAAES